MTSVRLKPFCFFFPHKRAGQLKAASSHSPPSAAESMLRSSDPVVQAEVPNSTALGFQES